MAGSYPARRPLPLPFPPPPNIFIFNPGFFFLLSFLFSFDRPSAWLGLVPWGCDKRPFIKLYIRSIYVYITMDLRLATYRGFHPAMARN